MEDFIMEEQQNAFIGMEKQIIKSFFNLYQKSREDVEIQNQRIEKFGKWLEEDNQENENQEQEKNSEIEIKEIDITKELENEI